MSFFSRFFSRATSSGPSAAPVSGMGVRRNAKTAEKEPKREPGASTNGKQPKVKPVLYTLLALFIFSGSIWLGSWLQQNEQLYDIEIRGTQLSAVGQIMETAGLQAGMPADSVKALDILARVEALPQIRRATLEFPAPDHLLLNVTEREPVAILVSGNRLMLVDEDGIVMEMPERGHPDLPLLYGFGPGAAGDSLDGGGFREVSAFLHALEHAAIAGATISELGWHTEDGVFGLSHENSVKLVFGQEDFAVRIKKWERFYRDVAVQRGLDAFLRLDFRFEDQIVAQEQDLTAS